MIEFLSIVAIVSFALMVLCFLGFLLHNVIQAIQWGEYSMALAMMGVLMFVISIISIGVLEVIAK